MTLNFPNPSRSFDEKRNAVRFSGYDGMFGPGTGAFLVIALVSALGYDCVTASAKAKIVNFATNLGALLKAKLSGGNE